MANKPKFFKSPMTFLNGGFGNNVGHIKQPTPPRKDSPATSIPNGSTILSPASSPEGTENSVSEIYSKLGELETTDSLHDTWDDVDVDDLSSPEMEDGGAKPVQQSFQPFQPLQAIQPFKRSHWKDATKALRCEGCDKELRFVLKKVNCRRCGEVFCDPCCQYRKRLGSDAEPNPQGSIHRVCAKCAELHLQPVGQIHNLTDEFVECRKNKRLVLSRELERLILGFEHNVNSSSSLKSAIHSFQVFKVPEWQKSAKWSESVGAEKCSNCGFVFSLISSKSNCRLCGYVYCDKCSNQNLLLYFDAQQQGVATLIGVVGCPDREPPISMYLSVCTLCEGDMEEYQVQLYHNANKTSSNDQTEKVSRLQQILEKLSSIQKKIDESVPLFHEQLETYKFEGHPDKDLNGVSNMEVFAKAHSDITGLFANYAVVLQRLKTVDMTTKAEMKMMQNIVAVKCESYNDGMNTYKHLRNTMDKCIPAKRLEEFQKFANTQAINNTYITTRQLGLEVFNICEKHSLSTQLPAKLSDVDEVCLKELDSYLTANGDNKKEHMAVLNNLLKEQMKVKTLVHIGEPPSGGIGGAGGRGRAGGAELVNDMLMERCSKILLKISSQLKAKSSETQFVKSKECLQAAMDFIADLKNQNDLVASTMLEYDIVEIS